MRQNPVLPWVMDHSSMFYLTDRWCEWVVRVHLVIVLLGGFVCEWSAIKKSMVEWQCWQAAEASLGQQRTRILMEIHRTMVTRHDDDLRKVLLYSHANKSLLAMSTTPILLVKYGTAVTRRDR